VSIKVRDSSYHFDRGHSPHAYRLIDAHLSKLSTADTDFSFEEHESGPELLVYLAMVTAGITLAKSLVDLIITIIKAKADGIKKGDPPSAPLELIVRRIENGCDVREEMILRIQRENHVDGNAIKRHLNGALRRLFKEKGGRAH